MLLLLGAILLGAMPFCGYDIGKLHPVRTIYAQREGDMVTLTADTGDKGVGNRWETAMEDMERSSDGVVFQGTVEYILLGEESLLPEVLRDKTLHANCVVCAAKGVMEPETAGMYLQTHTPDSTLRQLRQKEYPKLPVLVREKERFVLEAREG